MDRVRDLSELAGLSQEHICEGPFPFELLEAPTEASGDITIIVDGRAVRGGRTMLLIVMGAVPAAQNSCGLDNKE